MNHYEPFGQAINFRARVPRIVGVLTVGLLMSAVTFCGCLSRPSLERQTFAFSAPDLPATNDPASGRVFGIKTLRISPPFDGRSLIFRTGDFSYERDPYAEFLGLPSDGLTAAISEMLRVNGCNVAAGKLDGVIKPDTLLEINVSQLYGDIRKRGSPCAIVALQVVFVRATNGLPANVVLQQSYSRRIPMRSATAAALMDGWNQALTGIFADVAAECRRLESGA